MSTARMETKRAARAEWEWPIQIALHLLQTYRLVVAAHEHKSHRSAAARTHWACVLHPVWENLEKGMPANPYLRSPCQGGKTMDSHEELVLSFSQIQNTGRFHQGYNLLHLNSQRLAHRMWETVQCLSQIEIIQTPISHLPEGCPNHRTGNEEPLSSFMQQPCCSSIKASPHLSPWTATTVIRLFSTVWQDA